MPSYDYKCEDSHQTIVVRTMKESIEPSVECPTCGKPAGRVYSFGAVTFNGSGFYSTDKKGD